VGGTLQSTIALPGNVTIGNAGTLDNVPGVNGSLANAGTVTVRSGTTEVAGNYTQASTGILSLNLGTFFSVAGTAQIDGTLNILGAVSGYITNSHEGVMTAFGGLSGTFAQLTTSPGVFLNTTIQYTSDSVWLDTTSLSITQAAQAMAIVDPASSAAAARVQRGFDVLNSRIAASETVAPGVLQGAGAIQRTATPASAHATLQSLSGQLHAASAAMLLDGIAAASDALSGHFDDLLEGRAKAGTWYGDLGWQGDLQRGGFASASFRSNGSLVGADLRVGVHGILGYAVGASRGYGQLDASWDHNRTWTDHATLYGGVADGAWYAKAQIGSGWFHEDMQRLLLLGGLVAPVGSDLSGRYFAGSLEGGHQFRIGSARLTPFLDVRYQRLEQGAFAEQGGYGFGLAANTRTVGRLQAGAGVRAQRAWQHAQGMLMEFDGSTSWRRAIHQYGDAFEASFTGFDDWMPVQGIGLSRDESMLRAGLSFWPTRTFGLRLGYAREQGERQKANSVMLQGVFGF
jgi:fibronectin-binding autotransporter adhesin